MVLLAPPVGLAVEDEFVGGGGGAGRRPCVHCRRMRLTWLLVVPFVATCGGSDQAGVRVPTSSSTATSATMAAAGASTTMAVAVTSTAAPYSPEAATPAERYQRYLALLQVYGGT